MHDFTRAPGSISRPIGSTGRHPSFETGYSIAPSIAALYKFPPLDYHHYALLVRAMHLLLYITMRLMFHMCSPSRAVW